MSKCLKCQKRSMSEMGTNSARLSLRSLSTKRCQETKLHCCHNFKYNFCFIFKDFQLVTLEKLAELKQDVAGISTLLSSVLASQNAAVPQPASTVFNLLPIKTVDGFKELELELKNKASYDNLVSTTKYLINHCFLH